MSDKKENVTTENLIASQNGWLEYQMHVLTTLKRLDETFSRLEDQIKQIEARQNTDMTEFREELYELKAKMEKELYDIKMELKVEELSRLTAKLEAAKEEGAWEEKVDSHIEKKTKVNWILISAVIGSGFAAVNIIIKFILASLGVG